MVKLPRKIAFQRIYDRAKNDIFFFADYFFGFIPTDQQRRLMQAVQDAVCDPTAPDWHRYISVRSGQGVGKTTVAAIIAMWRTFRRKMARTAVTAPTMRQCKDAFLLEITRLVLEAPREITRQIIKPTKSKVVFFGMDRWEIIFVTAVKPENAQGLHNDHLTVMMDEASGIERPIVEQFLGTISNKDRLVVCTGNPNLRDSFFYDTHYTDASHWRRLHFNAEDSPLVSKQNIQRLRDKYGYHSDVYRVRVRGEFPSIDPDCVMSDLEVVAASKVDLQLALSKNPRLKRISIDFAAFGDDESVIYARMGNAIVSSEYYHKTDPNDVVEASFELQRKLGWVDRETEYVADAGGLGQGVMNDFYKARKKIYEFRTERRARQPKEFGNRMTEAMFNLRDVIRENDFYIPYDPHLVGQLTTRKYELVGKQGTEVLQLEPKKRFYDRIGKSPDRGDAMCQIAYDLGPLSQATGSRTEAFRSGRIAG